VKGGFRAFVLNEPIMGKRKKQESIQVSHKREGVLWKKNVKSAENGDTGRTPREAQTGNEKG